MSKEAKQDLYEEHTVVLKFPARWHIERVMGALRLGLTLESMAADLVMTSIGTYDTHSAKYGSLVAAVIDDISKQTGVKREDEDYGYADDWAMKILEEFIDKECKENRENIEKWENERMKMMEDDS